MINLPSLKFDFVGDRIESHVIRRRIVTTNNLATAEKCLVIDVRLDHPRTQDERSFVDCSWWLHPGTQPLGELGRAMKDAGAALGGPFTGDFLAVEMVGLRPPSRANKAPKKLYIVEYKMRGTEEEETEEELF